MKIFKKLLLKVRDIFVSRHDGLYEKNSSNVINISNQLPDVTEMEKTMFLLGKVHSVFDFAPPIPLVPEIRILNKALSYHYNFTNTNVEDAKKTTERVIQTVNKFSYILPEIDLLLNRMESTNLDIDKQELKKEIIASLEKVIDEKEDKQESIKNNNENK